MTCPTFEKLWYESEEYKQAFKAFASRHDFRSNPVHLINCFSQSPEFRNARLAFRRRMNKSPDSETT